MNLQNLYVVIYREGDGYVAQCLNIDVASEGRSAAEARDNLREALELLFDEPGAGVVVQAVQEVRVEQLTLKSA